MSTATLEHQAPSTVHFVSLMNTMRAHHKANPGTLFKGTPQKSVRALAVGDDPMSPDVLQQFTALKESTKSSLSSSTDQQKTDITNNTQSLQQTKNSNDFMTKMQQQRDAAKKANDDAIDAAYDKAIKLGTDHPEAQDAIASGMNFISQTVTKVLGVITDLISSLVSKIADILSAIFKPLEEIVSSFGNIGGLLAAL